MEEGLAADAGPSRLAAAAGADAFLGRPGVMPGDVVAFLTEDNHVFEVYDFPGDDGAVLHGIRPRPGAAPLADVADGELARSLIANPATHLHVVRQGKWLGFKCPVAGHRLLQVRRRGPHHLLFFSTQFGVWEQWEAAEGEPRGPWRRATILFRNRQLAEFGVRVQVVRLGQVEQAIAHMTPAVTPFTHLDSRRETEEDNRVMRTALQRWLGDDLGQLSGRVSDEVRMRDTLVSTLDHHLTDARRKLALYKARALAALARRRAARLRARAFRAWREDAHAVQVARHKLLRMMHASRERILRGALHYWQDLVARRHYHEALAAKSLHQVHAWTKAEVLGCWQQHARKQRLRRRNVHRASARVRRGAMSEAFCGWRAALAADRHAGRLLTRKLARRRTRQLGDSFGAWVRLAEDGRRTRQLAAWSHTRAQLLTESQVFSAWWTSIVAARLKHGFAVRAHHRAAAAATLEAWAGMAQQHKQLKLRLRQQAGRHRRRQLASCFAALRSHAKSRISSRAALGMLLRRSARALAGSALRAWRAVASGLALWRQRCGSAARRHDVAKVRRMFDAWLWEVSRQVWEARVRLQAAVRRTRHRLVGGAFRHWRNWPRERRRFNHAWAQVFRKWQERIARAVLHRWLAQVRRAQFSFRVLMPRLRRLHLSILSATLGAWFEHTKRRGRRAVLVAWHLERRDQASVFAAMAAWKAAAAEARRRVAGMLALAARAELRLLRDAFDAWAGDAAQAKWQRIVQILTMSHNRLLAARAAQDKKQAFYVLRAVIAEGKRKKHVLAMMAFRLMLNRHRRAFRCWHHIAAVHVARRRLVARGQRRHAYRLQSAAFFSWQLAHRERHARACAAAVMARSAFGRLLRSVLRAWRATVRDRERVLTSLLVRGELRLLAAALRAWRTLAGYHDGLRLGLGRGLHRHQLTALVHAFGALYDHAASRRAGRAARRRAGAYRAAALSARALRGWSAETVHALQRQDLAARACGQASRRARTRQLRAIVQLWCDYALEQAETRRLYVRVFRLDRRQLLARCLRRWWRQSVGLRPCRLALLRYADRTRLRAMRLGWAGLAAHVEARRRKAAIFARCGARRDRHLQARGLRAWHGATEAGRARRAFLSAARAMGDLAVMRHAAGRWADSLADAKVRRRVAAWWRARALRSTLAAWAMAADATARARRRKRWARAQGSAALLRRVLRAWAGDAGAVALMRRKLRNFSKRWDLAKQLAASEAWLAAARDQRATRQRRFREALRASERRRRRAWDDWVSIWRTFKAFRQAANKLALKMRARATTLVMRAWAALARELADRRELLERLDLRCRLHLLRRATYGWCAHVLDRARLRRAAAGVVRRVRRRQLSAALAGWCRVHEDTAAGVRIMARLALRKVDHHAADCFFWWAAVTFEARRMANLDLQAGRHRGRTLQRAGFVGLLAWAAANRKAKAALRRAAGHADRRLRLAALAAWAAHTRAEIRHRAAGAKAARMRALGELRAQGRALEAWHGATRRGIELRVAVTRLMAKQARNRAALALGGWRALAAAHAASLAKLRACITRKRVAMKWFLRWYWDAFDADIQGALCDILGETEGAMDGTFIRDSLWQVKLSMLQHGERTRLASGGPSPYRASPGVGGRGPAPANGFGGGSGGGGGVLSYGGMMPSTSARSPTSGGGGGAYPYPPKPASSAPGGSSEREREREKEREKERERQRDAERDRGLTPEAFPAYLIHNRMGMGAGGGSGSSGVATAVPASAAGRGASTAKNLSTALQRL